MYINTSLSSQCYNVSHEIVLIDINKYKDILSDRLISKLQHIGCASTNVHTTHGQAQLFTKPLNTVQPTTFAK